jgi:hypothetical protein
MNMKLDFYLDTMLNKETSDAFFIDEFSNDITNKITESDYEIYEVIDVKYELVARITIKRS